MTSFASKQILNRRQARWANELSELNFKIVYRPGVKNKRADSLTRRSSDYSIKEESPPAKILGPGKFETSSIQTGLVEDFKKETGK